MKFVAYLITAIVLLATVGAGVFIVVNRVPDIPVDQLKARWAPSPSRFVEINGMQVHLRDEGNPDDPTPIVLLHGTSASLHTWEGWVEALANERRIITFDMPAFGLTGPAPDGDYTIEAYARFVIAVLDKWNVNEPVVLGGNSLGGHIAWATAVLYPDRVEKLVLVDSSGVPFEAESMPIGFRIAQTPGLNKVMEQVLPRGMVEDSVKNVYADPSKVTPELVDRYFELTARAGNRAALAERFKQTQPGPLAAKIPELNIPTLIIWGKQDRLIPLAIGEQFDRLLPDSKLVVFDDLGHVPQEEDPVRTVAVVKEFLNWTADTFAPLSAGSGRQTAE